MFNKDKEKNNEMRIKKRNIQVAIDICIISFLIYLFVHFSSEETLLEIGNKIEGSFGWCSNIQVTTMQSFITTIMSGIFASTLVALFFYVQEYQREKEVQLTKLIKMNKDICKSYREIPYIGYNSENDFDKLARKYYLEYYDNILIEEISKSNNELLKKIPKAMRRELRQKVNEYISKQSNNAERKLISYIKNNPCILNTRIKGVDLTIEEKLQDIIKELDYKLDKAIKAYKTILSIDLTEMEDMLEDIDTFWGYGRKKRNFIKKKIGDETIYPFLYLSTQDIFSAQLRNMKNQKYLYDKVVVLHMVKEQYKCSTENTAQRICDIQRRGQTYIEKTFEFFDMEELKKYNKAQLLSGLLTLQQVFLDTDKRKICIGQNNNDITYAYNKFVYYMTNLDNILLLDLTERLKFSQTEDFVIGLDRFEGGGRICVKHYRGEEINPNIYRM